LAVQAMAAGLQPGMLVMFVSPNAVSQFGACLPAGWAWPDGVRAACTGPGTVAALHALGVPPAAVVAPARGRCWNPSPSGNACAMRTGTDAGCGSCGATGARLAGRDAARGRGRCGLPAGLSATGTGLDARAAGAGRRGAGRPAGSCWLLSSSEAIDHLSTLPQARWERAWALASHERIAARARQAGFGRVEDVAAGVEAVAQALKN
jgi:uroporphyrinogen-III synthase